MIYLDSAATSLQKPASVAAACAEAMRTMASPGRGGHRPAMLAAETAYRCRERLARMLGAPAPENVVFTMNATHGLNIAIRTLVRPGDRVVVSGYEHNAVTRPLHMLGAETDIVSTPLFDSEAAAAAFRERIPGAAAVVCTHVSNVFGFELPIDDIAAACARWGVPLVVDASQSAGVLRVDMSAWGARFVAMPGHKGLLGPQGTGVQLCGGDAEPIICGGTGSESRSQDMPSCLPDRLEAGTHNITGIAGLLAGAEYAARLGPERVSDREVRLRRAMERELAGTEGLTLYSAGDAPCQSGVLSVRSELMGSEELAAALGRKGVAVRAGLHCAPTAHETAGTVDGGTVRFSFSPFNTESEVLQAAGIFKKIHGNGPPAKNEFAI